MKLVQGKLDLSASDVSAAFSCHHRTALDIAVARGEYPAPTWFNPMTAALRERGLEHEQRYVNALKSKFGEVADLSGLHGAGAEAATREAMQRGAPVIVQAGLRAGVWNGRADVLLRVEQPSKLGAWSYEPVDTKLALETRAASILQLAFYSALLEPHLGRLPERFCVVSPGEGAGSFREEWHRVDDFHAFFRRVRSELASSTEKATADLLVEQYPEPVEHCDVCRFWEGCQKRRRDDDHLSLVAGISGLQRRELKEQKIETLAALGEQALPLEFKPKRGARGSYERVQQQARVQLRARREQRPIYELLPVDPAQGLATLPEPSPADVFLDIEGNPFAGNGPREYLFGAAYREGQEVQYRAFWAGEPGQERTAFEELMEFLMRRWDAHPAMHIYHYAPYEPSALKRLMSRYASREDDLDRLLRGGRFVDLYRVVRNGVRAGVERYSIKDLEAFYAFERTVDLRKASAKLRTVEQAIELSAFDALEADVLETVQSYNRDDCVSAMRLRDWLEQLRGETEASSGSALPRPELKDGAPTEEVAKARTEAQKVAEELLAGVPDEIEKRSDEQKARWLLANLLEFYRREDKVTAWELFRLRALTDDELLEEKAGLAGLAFECRVGFTKTKLPIDRYSFVEQDYEIREDKSLQLSDGQKFGEVVAIDRAARTIDVKKTKNTAELHPTAAFHHDQVSTKSLAEALLRLARWCVQNGIEGPGAHRAARDLLLRRAPRMTHGTLAGLTSRSTLELAKEVALRLDASVLPIQGPPGAGKTYTAAHMICALIAAGKTVGITAVSHKVIHKLLEGAVARGKELGVRVNALAMVPERAEVPPSFEETTDNKRVLKAIQDRDANLVGGTAWLWAPERCADVVDVMFVDEAGQMSLANVLAVSQAATSIVLIGDPQQLEQPIKGSHPDGVEVSALHHLLGEHKTVPKEAGIFLAETWRLAPAICAFTSELFYEGRLAPKPDLERQALSGTVGLDGAGLWYQPSSHTGCQSYSTEETQTVVELVRRLLVPGSSWIDREGKSHPLAGKDILVVAPYNAQVSRLAERLNSLGVKVGTVDKFQGQEAPVVIFSMTTSAPEDAPRGMEFLYSPNRLNVATSRAQCACFLVASPALFEPECKTVRHVKLANAFCRYLELARRA